jgi:type II secretory pathway component PulF
MSGEDRVPYELIEISRGHFNELLNANQTLNDSLELLMDEHDKLRELFFNQSTKLAIADARLENTALIEEELYHSDIACKDLKCQYEEKVLKCKELTCLLDESVALFNALKVQFDLYVQVSTMNRNTPPIED